MKGGGKSKSTLLQSVAFNYKQILCVLLVG